MVFVEDQICSSSSNKTGDCSIKNKLEIEFVAPLELYDLLDFKINDIQESYFLNKNREIEVVKSEDSSEKICDECLRSKIIFSKEQGSDGYSGKVFIFGAGKDRYIYDMGIFGDESVNLMADCVHRVFNDYLVHLFGVQVSKIKECKNITISETYRAQ